MDERGFNRIREGDEVLLAVFRKSFVPYARQFVVALLIGVIFTFVGAYVPNFMTSVYLFLAGFLISAVIMLRAWYLWDKSLFLITNLRVIALTQRGFFNVQKEEAYLDSVCNIATKVNGFQQSLFKYGRVLVQTEAELWLEDIERPHEANEAIFDALHRFKNKDITALPKRFWKMKEPKS